MAKHYEGKLASAIRAALAAHPGGLPTPEVRRLAGIPAPADCFHALQSLERGGIVRRVGTVALNGGLPAVIWALTSREDRTREH